MREKRERVGLTFRHACHEQGADNITVIRTVICSLHTVYNMPSPALGTCHYHYYIVMYNLRFIYNNASYLLRSYYVPKAI